jgi:hypothetical protein
MWLVTAPFFCAMPVKSRTLQALPSMCAAMPSSAPMVMTPVPPIPVTRMPYGRSSDGSAGCGSAISICAAPLGLRSVPPSTVAKLGQKPYRHE